MKPNKGWGIALIVLGLVVFTGALIDLLNPVEYVKNKASEIVGFPLEGIDWEDENAVREEGTLTVEVEGIETLRLENPAGRIRINGDSNAKAVTVHYTKKISGFSAGDGKERLAKDIKIDVNRSGNMQRIETEVQNGIFAGGRSMHVDYEIIVPPSLQIEVDNKAGEVTTDGLLSAVKITNNAGRVEVNGFKGKLDVNVNAGEISARGGTEIKAIDLSVNMGKVEVAIPDGTNLKVDARTNVGQIENELGIGEESRNGLNRELRGQTGTGNDGSITLRTNTGEIKLNKELGR